MRRCFACIAMLAGLISCRSYKMLDGKSRPVYFTPDTSVFNDPDFPKQSIGYEDLLILRGNNLNSVELTRGKTTIALISKPTIFIDFDEFLVYPGEHIIIKKGKENNFTFLAKNGNDRRNRELSFFATFYQKEQFLQTPRFANYTIDTILNAEVRLKMETPQVDVKSKMLFDSLANAFRVSEKFKKIASGYLESKNIFNLAWFYWLYRDTLQAHNLYKQKCALILHKCDGIIDKLQFEGVQTQFNQLADIALPYKPEKIISVNEFKVCFDSIQNNFSNLPKDYLLSRLMFTAYRKRIPISTDYITKYETACSDNDYKKLITKIKLQQQENDKLTIANSSNVLLAANGKTKTSLEKVLAGFKGKLVIIDCWASWCLPCREDVPFMTKLLEGYSSDKVVVLRLSIESDIQSWRKYVISNEATLRNHFLVINPKASSFVKEHDIQTIPRYMLIDKTGKLINADAPRPTDPQLKILIDKNL